MGMSTHRESGPYQQQPWERTPMDDRWADYTKVLTELFKPLADMAGLGNSFVILPASAMPAPGVCVTETATIYLADGLFGTALPEDLTDPNYWIRHPEVFGVVLHEVLHRLFSPQDWAGWLDGIKTAHGEKVAKIAVLMEEARIEAVGIRSLGPGSGYDKRSFPPLTPMMIVALKYSADRLISRGAAESVKSGEPMDSRERLSRLMILTMGRLVGGSAERHKGNNIDHSMVLIERATGDAFRQTAEKILKSATDSGTALYLDRVAVQWYDLMQSWVEPTPPEPEDDDTGCGGLPVPPEDADEPDDTGEAEDAGEEPGDMGEPQPEPTEDEGGQPGGGNPDDSDDEDEDGDQPDSDTPGGGGEDRPDEDSDEPQGSEGGSDDDSDDDDSDEPDQRSDNEQQSDSESKPPKPLDEALKDLFDDLQQQDEDEDTTSDTERDEHQRAAEAAMQEALASSAAELSAVRETRTGTRRVAKAKWGR